MILSGIEIEREMAAGNIRIEPYDPARLNPNSYNLTLADELMVYEDEVLDMKKKPTARLLHIPEDGILLQPGTLYLGRTRELTETHKFVPMIEGRSSVGRLGLFVHITAGFGDVGFTGFWTLEIMAIQPIRIYSGVDICQIFYHRISDDHREYRSNKYQHNTGIQASLLYRDFE